MKNILTCLGDIGRVSILTDADEAFVKRLLSDLSILQHCGLD